RQVVRKMYPHYEDGYYEYPVDRLLKLQDFITEDAMHNPDMLDRDNKPCLFVTKNGSATGVTIGSATGVFSYVREYCGDGTKQTSVEWSILPYDRKSGDFSAAGDSGSVIVDRRGRIGGLLTGGTGDPHTGDTSDTESTDITYATPFAWLFQRIKANGFPDAHLHPVIA
ncbi:uncharacterized protein B0H18DRAFT_873455, partial [Fomitopsis serialis]|uniref:uncharacterized protein n=1 Tax=Fomitopsis serialis TaxID=139415 RepID=UPI00200764B3